MRWKGHAEQQLSKITSRYHTTSLDMTSFLSRIFQHDSRTWNCHRDGLYQERTPSESTRRHMDVSCLILLTPLLVLCWGHCSDSIFVLRVINDSNIICWTIADGGRKLEERWQGNQRLLHRGFTYSQGKAHRTDQSWKDWLPLYNRFLPGTKGGSDAKKRRQWSFRYGPGRIRSDILPSYHGFCEPRTNKWHEKKEGTATNNSNACFWRPTKPAIPRYACFYGHLSCRSRPKQH